MDCEIQSEQIKQRKNVTWTEKMDQVLISFLFEEAVIGGKNKDSTWKSDTLKRAARLVEKACCFQLKNDNIRSRLKTLRAHWFVVHEAASQSGFSFNFITNCVEAEDISWVDYIKVISNTYAPILI